MTSLRLSGINTAKDNTETMSKFNEATRVQMPAMVHLTRLGYKYFGKISEEDAGKNHDPSAGTGTSWIHHLWNNLVGKYLCKYP